MENKKITDWKAARREELTSLKEQLFNAECERDAARKAWHENDNIVTYHNYRNTRELIEKLEHEIKRAEVDILPTEQKFCNDYLYSDIHAYEVVEERTPNKIMIRRLDAKRVDHNGMSDSQDYEFFSNPDYKIFPVYRHKNGTWGDGKGGNHYHVSAHPHEYYDYSF